MQTLSSRHSVSEPSPGRVFSANLHGVASSTANLRCCRFLRRPSYPSWVPAEGVRRRSDCTLNTISIRFSAPCATSVAEAPSAASSSAPTRGHVVVVGAGPAGVTAAMHLAAAGYRVDVLERRGHPAHATADMKRTYLIGLGERGLRVLEGLGVELGPGVARRMWGSTYMYKSGKRIDDPFTPDARIVGVDRQSLAAALVEAAEARWPGRITFHWDTHPEALDLEQHTVTLASGADHWESQVLHYDLLVGADGAVSAARLAMATHCPHMKVDQLSSPVAQMEYKAFHNLPHNPDIQKLLPKESLGAGTGADNSMVFFAFNHPVPDDPSPGSITLHLNARGSWSGTLYQPAGKFGGKVVSRADHEAAINFFAPEGFPREWIPLMAQQMVEAQPNRIHLMNYCSQVVDPSGRVVLLGDAAHNVTPQMGQGCNSALEDAAVLAAALKEEGWDLNKGLRKYEAQRLPQVHALQEMEAENAWVRRPASLLRDPPAITAIRVAWISFFMLLPLLRVLPGVKAHVHRSLFQTIMSTAVPYNRLHAMVYAAPLVWVGLLAALVAGGRAAWGWLAGVMAARALG